MFHTFMICLLVSTLLFILVVLFVIGFDAIFKEKIKKLRVPKIKFKDFKVWFLLCPEAYALKDESIYRFGLGDFRFSIIDTIRYKVWRKREHYRQAEEKNTEQIHMLLSYVKHDIEVYENKTRKEIERLG